MSQEGETHVTTPGKRFDPVSRTKHYHTFRVCPCSDCYPGSMEEIASLRSALVDTFISASRHSSMPFRGFVSPAFGVWLSLSGRGGEPWRGPRNIDLFLDVSLVAYTVRWEFL